MPCQMVAGVTQWSGRRSAVSHYGFRELWGAAPAYTTSTGAVGPRNWCNLLIKIFPPYPLCIDSMEGEISPSSLKIPAVFMLSRGKKRVGGSFFLMPDHFEALSDCNSFLLPEAGELIVKLQ